MPDLALPVDEPLAGRYADAAGWVRRMHGRGATVCSVCSGSLLLAEAGLLDGEEATTHWGYRDLFRAHYPRVRLRPERILVPAGEGHRVITSGGAASWQDLVLYLIARFCGGEHALHTAKVWLLTGHQEGQLPYAGMAKDLQHGDALIRACQSWIAEDYARPNPVARLIARSGLPERTFKRRFKAATGFTPMETTSRRCTSRSRSSGSR